MLNGRTARIAFLILAVVCMVGVYVNYFMPMPWVGTSVDMGGVAVGNPQQSYTGFVKRLAGFGRSSASTGLLIGLMMTWLAAQVPLAGPPASVACCVGSRHLGNDKQDDARRTGTRGRAVLPYTGADTEKGLHLGSGTDGRPPIRILCRDRRGERCRCRIRLALFVPGPDR